MQAIKGGPNFPNFLVHLIDFIYQAAKQHSSFSLFIEKLFFGKKKKNRAGGKNRKKKKISQRPPSAPQCPDGGLENIAESEPASAKNRTYYKANNNALRRLRNIEIHP